MVIAYAAVPPAVTGDGVWAGRVKLLIVADATPGPMTVAVVAPIINAGRKVSRARRHRRSFISIPRSLFRSSRSRRALSTSGQPRRATRRHLSDRDRVEGATAVRGFGFGRTRRG